MSLLIVMMRRSLSLNHKINLSLNLLLILFYYCVSLLPIVLKIIILIIKFESLHTPTTCNHFSTHYYDTNL